MHGITLLLLFNIYLLYAHNLIKKCLLILIMDVIPNGISISQLALTAHSIIWHTIHTLTNSAHHFSMIPSKIPAISPPAAKRPKSSIYVYPSSTTMYPASNQLTLINIIHVSSSTISSCNNVNPRKREGNDFPCWMGSWRCSCTGRRIV